MDSKGERGRRGKKRDELCYISHCPGHNRRKILAQSDSGQCSKIKACVGRFPHGNDGVKITFATDQEGEEEVGAVAALLFFLSSSLSILSSSLLRKSRYFAL